MGPGVYGVGRVRGVQRVCGVGRVFGVQKVRSGKQNIAEGSIAWGSSFPPDSAGSADHPVENETISEEPFG